MELGIVFELVFGVLLTHTKTWEALAEIFPLILRFREFVLTVIEGPFDPLSWLKPAALLRREDTLCPQRR